MPGAAFSTAGGMASRPIPSAAPLRVTRLGFGSAPLGEHKVLVPEEDATATLAAAYELGVRYFDTAPFYGYGLAEQRTGRFLKDRPRADYVLSSKVGRWLRPRTTQDRTPRPFIGGLPLEPVLDYSYDGTLRSIAQSLERLEHERLDIALIHDVDVWTHGEAFPERLDEAMNGSYRALRDLREQGAVGAVGVGVNDVASCLALAKRGEFDCFMLAGRYTLLEQGALDELLPLCIERDISVLVAAPFNSGILATGAGGAAQYNYRPAPEHVLERVRRIEAVCARHDVPLPAASLQFPLGHPAVASVVPGAISAAEARNNARMMQFTIPDDFWAELRAEKLIRPEAPLPRSRQ